MSCPCALLSTCRDTVTLCRYGDSLEMLLPLLLRISDHCRYLLAVMLANYFAALCLYVRYTWVCPPPLTSEAAKQAAMMDAKLARMAGSLGSQNLLAAGGSIPTVGLPYSKQGPAAAPVQHAAVGSSAYSKDADTTVDVSDHGVADAYGASAPAAAIGKVPAKSEGQAADMLGQGLPTPEMHTPGRGDQQASKVSLLQQVPNAVQGFGSSMMAAVWKVKDEVWEDDNFRWEMLPELLSQQSARGAGSAGLAAVITLRMAANSIGPNSMRQCKWACCRGSASGEQSAFLRVPPIHRLCNMLYMYCAVQPQGCFCKLLHGFVL